MKVQGESSKQGRVSTGVRASRVKVSRQGQSRVKEAGQAEVRASRGLGKVRAF